MLCTHTACLSSLHHHVARMTIPLLLHMAAGHQSSCMLQDNREKRVAGKGKFYQFMMRTKQPAGLVSNQLYLTMDDLADQVSIAPFNGSRSLLSCPTGSLSELLKS